MGPATQTDPEPESTVPNAPNPTLRKFGAQKTLRYFSMSDTTPEIIIQLRRKWKPHKRYLSDHPTAIRFHRACSWLDAALKVDRESSLDQVLILQWTAFNALYGIWNPERNEALPDRQSWKDFLTHIFQIDSDNNLGTIIARNRTRILAILASDHLDRIYWNYVDSARPEPAAARPSMQRRAIMWFIEERWLTIAESVLDRVYLLRCQLIHGAATCGSGLNRDPLRDCTQLLDEVIPAILEVWIARGAREDWGLLCYPPLQ